MEHVRPFKLTQLEAIARIFADTEEGLTGTEIAHLLKECRIPDPSPSLPKEKRLLKALAEYQDDRQFGNHVVMFINRAMNPANYKTTRDLFVGRQMQLARILAAARMTVGDDGRVRRLRLSPDADDPISREERLVAALKARGAHEAVIDVCRADHLETSFCLVVFEALQRLTAKIQLLSGLTVHGTDLARQAFSISAGKRPLIAVNALSTENERAEQRAVANLTIGLFGVIRNPAAHNPKIEWDMKEQDAADVLTMISMVLRTLERAAPVAERVENRSIAPY